MLDRSTQEIIAICRQSAFSYEMAVKKSTFMFGLLGGSTSESYTEFKQLLDRLKTYQAKETVLAIYNFYMELSFASRLRVFIQDALFQIFNIDPNVEFDIFGPVGDKPLPGDFLDEKMMYIKHELGLADERDMLLPSASALRYYS